MHLLSQLGGRAEIIPSKKAVDFALSRVKSWDSNNAFLFPNPTSRLPLLLSHEGNREKEGIRPWLGAALCWATFWYGKAVRCSLFTGLFRMPYFQPLKPHFIPLFLILRQQGKSTTSYQICITSGGLHIPTSDYIPPASSILQRH